LSSYSEAVSRWEDIQDRFSDSWIGKDALFGIWELSFNQLVDKVKAESAMNRFLARYPDDERVAFMKSAMEGASWDIPKEPKGKDVASGSQMPSEFSLLQNYPNPFNATTELVFTLPEGRDVELVVFNILGQRVRTLVRDHKEGGIHRVRWDGKDGKGRDVSSGLYFCNLRFGGKSDSIKLLLLR